jgi:hypothetical protein
MKKQEISNKESIIKIQGELKLLHHKINTIETNHFKHIQDDISKIIKILISIGMFVGAQFFYLLKDLILK